MWVLRDRATGEFVGRGGPQYTDALGARRSRSAGRSCPSAGARGWPPSSRCGSVEVAFADARRCAELIAFTLPDNLASRRVMEKAGFAYERDIVHAGLPHVLYRRDRRRRERTRDPPGPLLGSARTSRPPL